MEEIALPRKLIDHNVKIDYKNLRYAESNWFKNSIGNMKRIVLVNKAENWIIAKRIRFFLFFIISKFFS